MYARVTTGQVDMEKMQAAQRANPRPATDPIAQMPGFRGNFYLLDGTTGKGMIVGLWETEADLQASMGHHRASHEQNTAAGIWVAPPTIEVFEVIRKNDPPQ